MNVKIGNIIADEKEFIPFKECLKSFDGYEYTTQYGFEEVRTVFGDDDCKIELVTIFSRVGKVPAGSAAAYLIVQGCEYIINSGLSGAISGVHIDDFVAGTQYQMTDFDMSAIGIEKGMFCDYESIFYADSLLLEAFMNCFPFAKQGKLAPGAIFVADSETKHYLKSNFNAIACDMESAAIAYVCHRAGVPFFSFRRVSDDADDTAYESYREMNEKAEENLFELTCDFLKELLKIFNKR